MPAAAKRKSSGNEVIEEIPFEKVFGKVKKCLSLFHGGRGKTTDNAESTDMKSRAKGEEGAREGRGGDEFTTKGTKVFTKGTKGVRIGCVGAC
ncbi:MAG: hypothetical protein LBT53_02065 [Puniceicoccales bacterium]|nr:hypothetical protein [Puniceicoccales bacterium]